MLSYLKNRRIKRFTDELPNAMDVIVRGIRAGLPLGDCVRIIASEAQRLLWDALKDKLPEWRVPEVVRELPLRVSDQLTENERSPFVPASTGAYDTLWGAAPELVGQRPSRRREFKRA